VVSNGCGELINDPLHLLETLHHWLDQDGKELAARTKRAQELGHADAAFKVADEVWRAANCPAGERSVTHLFERSHLVRMLREYRKDLEEITRGP